MRAVSILPTDVVLDCDPDEVKTTWTIKPLTNLENAYIRDRATRIDASESAKGQDNGKQVDAEIGLRTGTMQVLTVAFGVAAVRDFRDGSGNELLPEYTEVPQGSARFRRLTNAFIQQIPAPALEELALKIGEISELTEAERKSLRTFREANQYPDVSGVSGE